MLIPYRCKNPVEKTPYATYWLIALCTITYLFTTNSFIEVKDGILADYALSPEHLTLVRLIVSMFIHGQPIHLIGNMWFLWLFGAAAEGRLGVARYLLVYFVSGLSGGLAQCALEAAINSNAAGFGADGAVLGIAGAYLIVFPYARVMVFRFFIITLSMVYIGPAEWMAWWVMLFYAGLNVVNGIIAQAMHIGDFMAYFAHLAGFFVGIAAAFILRVQRDSELTSQAQAVRADFGEDVEFLSLTEMESIIEGNAADMAIVLAYCRKVMLDQGEKGEKKALQIVDDNKLRLLTEGDIDILSDVILTIPKTIGGLPGGYYLRLGSKLEQMHKFETSAYIYRRCYDLYFTTPDAGAALIRLARIWERVFANPELSHEAYSIYLEHFVNGPLTEDAQKGFDRVTEQLSGTGSGRVPQIKRELHEQNSFSLLAEEPGDPDKRQRTVAAPDLIDHIDQKQEP